MRYAIYPSTRDAVEIFREALRNKEMILVVGRCTVDYEGRASSTLSRGERLLIIKQDGATLIHRPNGYKPVNWQPAETQSKAYDKDGALVVEIARRHPKEWVRITFENLKSILSDRLADEGEFYIYASEKDMQRAVFLNPSIVEKGLKNLKVEKEHPDGYVDVLAKDSDGRTVVIEIKRKKATRTDVLQMHKYVSEYRRTNPSVRGILVAPSASKKAYVLLSQLDLEFKPLSPRKCDEILRRRIKRGERMGLGGAV
ncbi:MAG: endonuclease NucS [Candidatus Geothermarchaeales archaeon]